MKLIVKGLEYPCTSAVKTEDEVRIVDTDGNKAVFSGITNMDDYVLEDGEWTTPDVPPTNEELAAENKLLKQQVSALTEQQSFYEDCIAEMAAVVYA